jgi:hypothetical protein
VTSKKSPTNFGISSADRFGRIVDFDRRFQPGAQLRAGRNHVEAACASRGVRRTSSFVTARRTRPCKSSRGFHRDSQALEEALERGDVMERRVKEDDVVAARFQARIVEVSDTRIESPRPLPSRRSPSLPSARPGKVEPSISVTSPDRIADRSKARSPHPREVPLETAGFVIRRNQSSGHSCSSGPGG